MTTEDTLDSPPQDAPANPETTPESDSPAQPETDWKALLEAEKAAKEDAEKRYAELRKDYDKKAHQSKKTKEEAKTPEDDTLWLIEHASELKLVKDEYAHYTSLGYQKDHALKLAKLDKGIKSTERIPASSPTAVVDRTEGSDPITPEERAAMQQWGFDEEALREQKRLKQLRG